MPNAGAGATGSDRDEPRRYRPEKLFGFCCQVLERLDVPSNDAAEVAGCLIKAELRGVDSHGMVRLPVYSRRIQAGVVKPVPEMQVRSSGTAAALVDGDNGLGPVVGSRAMATALELAAKYGTGFVGACRSNHFGAAAYYVEKAIAQGCIGFAASNAPPNMAPFGGRERFLGTNPIAIGIPAGRKNPLIFDASTSVVARGKIIVAAHTKQPVPQGWAIDPQGRSTTDAREALAGAVLPFGGAKGSAISFIVDILCGVLTGAAYAVHLNTLENLAAVQNVGHVFAALRTDLFMSAKEFESRMDEILDLLKASPPAPGVDRVLAPGDVELASESRLRAAGIPLAAEIVEQLTSLGEELGVPFPSAGDGGTTSKSSHHEH
jgi:LDH2 family malate/lactate/ureidoglycolate dehydrogenase